jgi:hypothetical protein
MGTLLNRRRVMRDNPYDEFGYIKSKKTFHLDGISIGNNTNAWTDLIGGVVFPIVNGVTHNNDHFQFASDHEIMSSSTHTQLNFPQTGTLEVVVRNINEGSVIYSGKRDTMSWTHYAHRVYSGIETAKLPYLYIRQYTGKLIHTSVSKNAIYLNGELQQPGGEGYVRKIGGYCVIGNGWVSDNAPLVGDIYSIRYYNRVLTEDEVLHNYNIDKQRFNLE